MLLLQLRGGRRAVLQQDGASPVPHKIDGYQSSGEKLVFRAKLREETETVKHWRSKPTVPH